MGIFSDENRPEVSNLINIFSALSGKQVKEIDDEYRDKNTKKFKDDLTEIVVNAISPIREKTKELITLLPSNNLSVPPITDADEPEDNAGCLVKQVVDKDTFINLKKAYGEQAVTGLGRIAGTVVGIVATKGGITDKASAEKITGFVRFCDAFAIPVITFADSEGFADVKDAVKVTSAYADATTVKITVIKGKAYGAFYLAMAGSAANADITYALDNASVSPLAPVTGAAIMWADRMAAPRKEREQIVKEYEQNECNSQKAAAYGYVNDVIAKEDVRFKLYTSLEMLAGKRVSTMPKKHATI